MTPDESTTVTAERIEQALRPERRTELTCRAEEMFEPDDWDR